MAISLKPEYLKRYKDIATLLWKYGRSDLVTSSGLDAAMDQGDRPMASMESAAPPEELAKDLEAMGPIYIKLGQVLSSRSDILPSAYVKALARLQDNIAPFSFAEVEQIVQEELGVRLSKAFEIFESTPIASASLGQVHRARLRDGREVAVKIQRPAIREQVAQDIQALTDIAEFLDAHTSLGNEYHFVNVLEEFRRTIFRELDYRQEARNLVEIGKNLAEFESIVIPQPVDDYSTDKVLTMDFVRGKKITSIGPLMKMEMNGIQLSDQLFRAYLKQILVDGVFHADPHPGNVFITNDGSLALIDLGMVGRMSVSMQEQLLKLLLVISEMRSDEAAQLALKMGEKIRVPELDFSEGEFRRKIAMLFEDKLGVAVKDLQVGSILMDYSRVCSENGVRMPPELTMLGKTLLNLDEVARTLDPNFDPNAAIRKNAVSITERRLVKSLSPSAVLSAAMEAKEFTQELPGRINRILDAFTKNEFKIQVDAIEEETLITGFQKVANRIATALILASLIIGASMLMKVDTVFKIFGYPGLAIICFLIAAIGGLWLVFEIAMHDRHARKKG